MFSKNGYNAKHAIAIAAVAVYGFLAVGSTDDGSGDGDSSSSSSSESGCSAQWQKCTDNSDLVNNYDGISLAKVRCETTAERMAKYGDPEFPWIAFGTYLEGTNYVETGRVTLIEDDAQFQNGFGAMVNSTVRCVYNLRTEEVVDMTIN